MSSAGAIAFEPCPTCARLRYDGDCRGCAGEGRIQLRAVEPAPVRALSAYAIECCAAAIHNALVWSPYCGTAAYEAPIVAGMLTDTILHGRAEMVRLAEKRLPGVGEKVVRAFIAGLVEHASVIEYAKRLDGQPSEARTLRALARELGGEECVESELRRGHASEETREQLDALTRAGAL